MVPGHHRVSRGVVIRIVEEKSRAEALLNTVKEIELDRVNLKIPTATSKIVFQSSMVKSLRPMSTFEEKKLYHKIV